LLTVVGRDTTASTLSWAFYSLALNPDINEKLYQEAKGFDETVDHAVMFEEIRNGLKYAHAV
jgi:cytochrome P450